MSLTLTEAQKYTTNSVLRGVIMEIAKDSIVMQKLPFKNVVGNALQYLRETTLATASFYAPNEQWTESTGVKTQYTAGITILGGDADIDEFLQKTRSDHTNIQAETIDDKSKAVKHTFLDRFWNGDASVNTKEFSGLHKLIQDSSMSAQVIHQGSSSTGAALTATNLDTGFDLIKDGPPEALVTTRNIRRRMSAYIRSKGAAATAQFGAFGQQLKNWNDTPVSHDDFLLQTETIATSAYSAKTGGATGSVFYLKFGDKQVCGLQNGGLTVIPIGQLEDRDAMRWRIKWYVGLAIFQALSIAMIDGITDAAMTD